MKIVQQRIKITVPTPIIILYTFRYSVENAYLEEKEDTCNALGEMVEHLGPSFLPYLDDCFREVNILSEVSSKFNCYMVKGSQFLLHIILYVQYHAWKL